MKRIIIGASEAGRYGLRIGGKTATILQNRGGFPSAHMEEQAEYCGRSNEDAIRKAALKAGLDAEEALAEYRGERMRAFLDGFAEATGLDRAGADEAWAAWSRQLPDSERERIERGGKRAGLREGRRYVRETEEA